MSLPSMMFILPMGERARWGLSKVLQMLWLCAVVWAALCMSPAWAQALVPVPPLTARVIDQTGTLAAGDVATLEQLL